jgi:hypothetical protein
MLDDVIEPSQQKLGNIQRLDKKLKMTSNIKNKVANLLFNM